MASFSVSPLLFLLIWILGFGLCSIGDAFKVPFRVNDVLPVLPRGISWPVLNNFHSAVDLLPYFVGSVTPGNSSSIEWKGACFLENKASLEFIDGDRDEPGLGGGVIYLEVAYFDLNLMSFRFWNVFNSG